MANDCPLAVEFSILLLITLSNFGAGKGGFCPKVCDWNPWGTWSTCSLTCGGGTRTRQRSLCCLPFINIDLCKSMCDKEDEFRDQDTCNALCVHGSYNSYWEECRCTEGYYGTCCDKGKAYSDKKYRL